MQTYKEIKRLTGNNKGFAAAALATLTETCWWVEEKPSDVIYLRTTDNDWVAIPDAYTDEIDTGSAPEFYTTRGKSVTLSIDSNYNWIAVEVVD